MSREEILRAHPLREYLENKWGMVFELQGGNWVASCKLHDGDNTPSFNIYPDGHYHCFGCGAHGRNAIDFLIAKTGCSFVEAMRELSPRKPASPKSNYKPPEGPEVAFYEYRDETGRVLYHIVRYDPPKDFRPYRVINGRRDDFPGIKKKGVRLVPYNLPAVLKADRIFVCEGEKDCETMAAAGFVATTNAFGKNGDWLDDWNPFFKGKRVFLIPDVDEDKGGEKHMADVARKLGNAPAELKICKLPFPFKDAADLAAASTSERGFRQAIENSADAATEPGAGKGGEDATKGPSVTSPTKDGPAPCNQGAPDYPDLIILPSGELSITRAARNIYRIMASQHDERPLFLYGGQLSRIAAPKGEKARAEVIGEKEFCSVVEQFGVVHSWMASDPPGNYDLKRHKRCSVATAGLLLNCYERRAVPRLSMIHACPILTSDGSVLGPGYHPEFGGRFVDNHAPALEIPSLPRGRELLLEILSEFEFATPGDKSRALATLLAPAMIPCDLCGPHHFPAFVVEADQSQAGKGYLCEVTQAIYGEQASLVAQKKGGVGSTAEAIDSALVFARLFIQLDNLKDLLNLPSFEMVLTTPHGNAVMARIPFKGPIPVRPDRFIWHLTSNGFKASLDLTNRALILRIRKKEQGYKFRTFANGNKLVEHVFYNRGQYLGAVFSVLRHWIQSGRPKSLDSRPFGRIREVCQAVDWVVQEIFGGDPLWDGHEEIKERVSDPARDFLRSLCLAVAEDAREDEKLSASDLLDVVQSHFLSVPGVTPDTTEKQSLMLLGRTLGRLFHGKPNLLCDNFTVEKEESEHYDHESGRSFPAKRYTIKRIVFSE